MDSRILDQVAIRLAELTGVDFNYFELKDKHSRFFDYDADQPELFFNDLIEKSRTAGMVPMRNALPPQEFSELLRRAEHPIVAIRQPEPTTPVLFYFDDNKVLRALEFTEAGQTGLADPDSVLSDLYRDEFGDVVFLTAFPMESIVSKPVKDTDDRPMTPWRRLMRLFGTEKRDIYYVYVYAIAAGLINLSLPLGVQATIGLVAGGLVFNSIIVLIGLVVVGVLISGGLQVMQLTMVEVLQRRVFARAAFEFAYRLPRMKVEALRKYYPPELMNRFFDVLTVQKGLPKILIDITAAVLQIVFGLLLLAFYHPFFVFFGFALIGLLILMFYFTGNRGLQTSLYESKYKYKVVYWLEEMARTVATFKLAGHSNLPTHRMDVEVNGYLDYRKQHFRVLLTQYIYIVGFKTVIIGGLLAIGTILVVNREISLGQFVASELVIVLIIGAVEKIILSMDVIYDTLTGVEKIGNVTDIPLERPGGVKLRRESRGLDVRIHDLTYKHAFARRPSVSGFSLDIKPGERVCISGPNESGKGTLVGIMAGTLSDFQGTITYDGISIRDVSLEDLRDQVSKYVSQEDLFEGSLLENLTLGKNHISYEDVSWALDQVGLLDEVNELPEGVHTRVIANGRQFSDATINKLMIARCVAVRPRLLVLNDFLHYVGRAGKTHLSSFLTDPKHGWTFVAVSNDPIIQEACDRVIVMKDGKLIDEGPYEEIRQNQETQDILSDA